MSSFVLASLMIQKFFTPDLIEKFQTDSSSSFFLANDCCIPGKFEIKQNKELDLSTLSFLLKEGFYFLWVYNDKTHKQTEQEKIQYEFKTELYYIFKRRLLVLDEAWAKKPGSAIESLEKDDLLRFSLNPLNLEGVAIIAHRLFGKSFKVLDKLYNLCEQYWNNIPETISWNAQISCGCIPQEQPEATTANKEMIHAEPLEEKIGNWTFQRMAQNMLIFLACAKKIQSAREHLPFSERRHYIAQKKRHPYSIDEIFEVALSVFLAEYGFFHAGITDLLLQLNNNPLISSSGKILNNGFHSISNKKHLILNKHCNVSKHLFLRNSDRFGELSQNLFQYHHRNLTFYGYPKRKIMPQLQYTKDAEHGLTGYKIKAFHQPILELSRLGHIISFFSDTTWNSPLHIPFRRESIVHHLLKFSLYPKNADGQADTSGQWELDTLCPYPHPYAFDAYLVNIFLNSINVYHQNEQVPIYSKKHKIKIDDAIVLNPTGTHRPNIKLLSNSNIIDLRSSKCSDFIIGEYGPSLDFGSWLRSQQIPFIPETEQVEDYQHLWQKVIPGTKQNHKTHWWINDLQEKNDNNETQTLDSNKLSNKEDTKEQSNNLSSQEKTKSTNLISTKCTNKTHYILRQRIDSNYHLPFGIGHAMPEDSSTIKMEMCQIAVLKEETQEKLSYIHTPLQKPIPIHVNILNSFDFFKCRHPIFIFEKCNPDQHNDLNKIEHIKKKSHLIFAIASQNNKKNEQYLISFKSNEVENAKIIRSIAIMPDAKLKFRFNEKCGTAIDIRQQWNINKEIPFVKLCKILPIKELLS